MPPGLDEDELLRRMMHLVVDHDLARERALDDVAEDIAVAGHLNLAPEDELEEDEGLSFVESFRAVTSLPRGYAKARRRPRSLAEVDTVVVHQTAVEGGFGVSARLRERHGGDAAAARQTRYRDTPYHGVYSPRDRTSIVQWPAWCHTYHGHGGNKSGVGWVYDGMLPGDELDELGARISLRHFVLAMRGSGVALRYVEAHRQHSSERGGDPGAQIWARVVLPLLAELGLEARAERTTGNGLSLPAAWFERTQP